MAQASNEAIRRYRQLLNHYRNRTSDLLVGAWDSLGSYGEEDVDRYEKATRPAILGAREATVAAAAAFYALSFDRVPIGVSAKDIDVEARIRDPFLALWHAVAEGRPNDVALLAGRSMAAAVGFDFVQSLSRRTGDTVAKKHGERIRWERVPGASACEWCETVAGQTYASAESADFGHDRCDCVAVPA